MVFSPNTFLSDLEVTTGIPDIICCYRGKFVLFEVKTSSGKLSKLQKITIKRINEAGGMAFKVVSLQEVNDILKGLVLEK